MAASVGLSVPVLADAMGMASNIQRRVPRGETGEGGETKSAKSLQFPPLLAGHSGKSRTQLGMGTKEKKNITHCD